MPDRMLDKVSDRMPEDLSVTKCINVMVGITRSKVICFLSGFLQMTVVAPLQRPFSTLCLLVNSIFGWSKSHFVIETITVMVC